MDKETLQEIIRHIKRQIALKEPHKPKSEWSDFDNWRMSTLYNILYNLNRMLDNEPELIGNIYKNPELQYKEE